MIRYLLAEHKGKLLACAAVVAALACFAVLGFVLPGHHGGARTVHGSPQHSATASGSASDSPGTAGSTVLSARERAQLDAAPDVPPSTTRLLPPVPARRRTQPDVYARAFFTALFVHPYVGVTRHQMLAWLQSQQAESPFITGGTSAERRRLLVESASDPAWSNHGAAALPDTGSWAQASAGRMRVRLGRLVSVTPPAWEHALTAGEISDPGLTERLVSGDLTATLTRHGRPVTQKVSVALTLLLEGPPTAREYGVVVIGDTTATAGAR